MVDIIAKLPGVPGNLFVRHHLYDECIQQLAVDYGRTPHTVEQTPLRTKKRLRVLMDRKGLTEEEFRGYLANRCLVSDTGGRTDLGLTTTQSRRS